MIILIVSILIIVMLAYVINYFLIRSIIGRGYRIFVAPGIIVHELAHALACKLTGAKISKINLFGKTGGSVHHTKSKIPIIGQLIISLAPIVIGIGIIYLLSYWLGRNNINFGDRQNHQSVKYFLSILENIQFGKISTWVVMYAILAIAVTMTPSWEDIKHILVALFIIGLVIFLLKNYLSGFFEHLVGLQIIFQATIFILIIGLIISFGIYLISRFLKIT